MRKPVLSPDRNKGGNQPLMKGPFFIFLFLMPAFLVLVFFILLAMQYKQLKALVSPQPLDLPALAIPPEATARVRAELDSFLLAPRPSSIPQASAPAARTPGTSASAAGEPSSSGAAAGGAPARNSQDTLALDAADLNALIRGSAALEKLHLDYHLSLQDTLLVARNSLPVERLNGALATLAKVLHVRGYLNSEMRAYPKLEGGKLYLVPVSAVMNGIPAPPSVLSSKGKIEAREWVADKDAFDRAASRLSDIKIRGGRLLLIRG